MAQATVPASKNSTPAQGAQAQVVPPEEQFWKRYSPHHEFPLSAVTSFVLHAIVITVLACGALILLKLGLKFDKSEPLPLDEIVIAGGGGNPDGSGNGPGSGVVGSKHEEAVPDPNPKPTGSTTQTEKVDVNVTEPDPLQVAKDLPEDSRFLPDVKSQVGGLQDIGEQARKEIFRGLGPPAGKGKGGTGSGGGKGAGKGTGEGDLEGAGKSRLNIRQQRVLRWIMNFNTRSGGDYAQQLIGLNAILAIPAPEGGNRWRIVRDLRSRPVRGDVEDLASIQRIFWVDNKPQSVSSLAQALGIRPIPPQVVAFFPKEFEDELLQKELAYRGRKEEEIKETFFRVVHSGGRYEAVVEDQRLK